MSQNPSHRLKWLLEAGDVTLRCYCGPVSNATGSECVTDNTHGCNEESNKGANSRGVGYYDIVMTTMQVCGISYNSDTILL